MCIRDRDTPGTAYTCFLSYPIQTSWRREKQTGQCKKSRWVQRKHVNVKNTEIWMLVNYFNGLQPTRNEKRWSKPEYILHSVHDFGIAPLNRCLSTRWHPAHHVSLLILNPREIQALSQLIHDKETGGFCDHRACISLGGRIGTDAVFFILVDNQHTQRPRCFSSLRDTNSVATKVRHRHLRCSQGCVFPGSSNYPKLIGLEVMYASEKISYVPSFRQKKYDSI